MEKKNGLLVVCQDRTDKDIFNEPMVFVLICSLCYYYYDQYCPNQFSFKNMKCLVLADTNPKS